MQKFWTPSAHWIGAVHTDRLDYRISDNYLIWGIGGIWRSICIRRIRLHIIGDDRKDQYDFAMVKWIYLYIIAA